MCDKAIAITITVTILQMKKLVYRNEKKNLPQITYYMAKNFSFFFHNMLRWNEFVAYGQALKKYWIINWINDYILKIKQ